MQRAAVGTARGARPEYRIDPLAGATWLDAGIRRRVAVDTPGSINLGGPIVTAGGLVFIAGTVDRYLRAFDVETGKELWKGALPASGHATPMTYRAQNGKQ